MASFQLKNFVSITASMLNRMKATQSRVTDFSIGSVARTMLEAPASEMDEIYQQAFNLVTAAIPVSVYNSFNFAAQQAAGASGLIRTTITAQSVPTLIGGGTQFRTPNNSAVYASAADVIVPAGSTYADVQVAATTTGASTNLPSGATFSTTPSISGFLSATNLSSFDNGQDAETDDQRQIRFNAFISTLPRGTVAALQYGLSTANVTDAVGNITERVVFSSIVEPYVNDNTQPIALVNCYIHNGVGNTSNALVTQAQKVLYGYYTSAGVAVPGWKAAGVPVTVQAATEVPLAVTGVLTTATGFDHPTLCTLAQSAVFTYLQNLPIGATAVFAEMVALVMAIPGVLNIRFSQPKGSDTTATVTQKIMPGVIAVT